MTIDSIFYFSSSSFFSTFSSYDNLIFERGKVDRQKAFSFHTAIIFSHVKINDKKKEKGNRKQINYKYDRCDAIVKGQQQFQEKSHLNVYIL